MANIQNIHNQKRKIYVFERLDSGDQVIYEDDEFYPYYYEQDPEGKYETYDGNTARKVITVEPGDVAKQRSSRSYESDVIFTKRYIIDRLPEFHKCPFRYVMMDIEIWTKDLPDVNKADKPISCITTYDSFKQEYKQWFLSDWSENENGMLDDFTEYMQKLQPDLIVGWFMNGFDFPYLCNRIPNFARRISPIKQTRRFLGQKPSGVKDLYYPAGISVIDYDAFYKRIYKGLKDNKLDTVLAHEFGKGKEYHDVDFGSLDISIKKRNFEDVEGMQKIEEKKKILEHYDEIRRFARVEWEDLTMNSRGIDICLFEEAKKKNIVLPKKPDGEDAVDFEGAFREAFGTGAFFNLGKYDLSGAYLYTIMDLCLDSSNIVDKPEPNTIPVRVTDRESGEVTATYNIRQNSDALLPTIVSDITNKKNTFKKLMTSTDPNDESYDDIVKKYNGIKEFALSYWGVIGNRFFRIYDSRIASMITASVRDLLHYVRDEVHNMGYEVVYIDTDSVFVKDNGKDLTKELNELIQKWAHNRFGKGTQIVFDYEGRFEKILILGKCHYYGYLEGRDKPEIKGVEVKRSSSTKYEAWFQEELINRILNGKRKDEVSDWIRDEKERIKTVPLTEIACPCKLSNSQYKVRTIFMRALDNTRELMGNNFRVDIGESFYYIYVDGLSREMNVLAIKDDTKLPDFIKIDWKEMTNRNVINKAKKVFTVMGWGEINALLDNQMTLF